MFNKLWFFKHQKILLWLLNTPIISLWFRWILRINGDRSSVGSKKIIGIIPNAIFWGGKIKGYHFVKGKKVYKQEFKAEFRTHNKFSKRLFYAFYPIWYLFHLLDFVVDPILPKLSFGFSTLTVYPDPATGATTVDGFVGNTSYVDWATARASATDGVDTNTTDTVPARAYKENPTSWRIIRGIFNFDTSSLTNNANISAAVFSLFGTATVFNNADTTGIGVTSSNSASNNSLVAADYNITNFGSTAYASILFSAWSKSAYNDFTLDANGRANVNKTGVSKFGTRCTLDFSNTAPTILNDCSCYFADQAGTTNDPKLVVTYTLVSMGGGILMAFMPK